MLVRWIRIHAGPCWSAAMLVRCLASHDEPAVAHLAMPVLLSEFLVRVSCPSLLSESLVRVSCPSLLSESLVRVSCPSLLSESLVRVGPLTGPSTAQVGPPPEAQTETQAQAGRRS
jgi:hypothetical protein